MKTATATIALMLLFTGVEAHNMCRHPILHGNGTLVGKVYDGDSGSPLSRVRVDIVPSDMSMVPGIQWDMGSGMTLGRTCTTGLDGSFVFTNLMLGTYRVRVRMYPYQAVEQSDVRVDSTGIAVVSIQLIPSTVPPGWVDGVVRHTKCGQPVHGTAASLSDLPLTSTTGDEGHFQIKGVPPGMYTLRAISNLHDVAVVDSVMVLSDQVTLVDVWVEEVTLTIGCSCP